MRAPRAGVIPALAALLAASCGAPSADLFAVERDGPGAGARLRLVVSNGGEVRCNGRERELPADLLLDARELARDVERQAELGLRLPPGRGAVFRYVVHVEAGTVTFADNSRHLPDAFRELTGFSRIVSRQVCGLRR